MARHLLVTNDYPPKTGGIQVYLHELWRRLEPDRAVVLTASSHPEAAAFDATSESSSNASPHDALPADLARARAIEAAIERHQPDLVLIDPAWPLGLLGPSLSRSLRCRLARRGGGDPGRIPFVASSLRYVLRHAAVVICAGYVPRDQVRRNTAEYMPPVIQVPPGVDT